MEYKEGIHYELVEEEGGYYVCLSCRRCLPKTYSVKSPQPPKKQYGTKQLMALWAWNNFKRHLKKCAKKNMQDGRELSIDEKNSDRIRSRREWYGKNPGQHQ